MHCLNESETLDSMPSNFPGSHFKLSAQACFLIQAEELRMCDLRISRPLFSARKGWERLEQNSLIISETDSNFGTLREKVVLASARNFDWAPLKKHLDQISLNQDATSRVVSLLRRCNDFLIKRPNTLRASKRKSFIDSLQGYIVENAGPEAADLLSKDIAMILQIEAGYKEILSALESTEANKLLSEAQASAALYRAAFSYNELQENISTEIQEQKEYTAQSFRISGPNGTTHSPDGLIGGIASSAAMTLSLLGHRYGWFDADKLLVLPSLPETTEAEVYKAGLTELLAVSWREWERMEQRCRYFGGELRVSSCGDIPDWAPKGAETLVEYDEICDLEVYDHLANQRLNDRMVQTFQEMSLIGDMEGKSSGISDPLELPPAAFVSPQECHAEVSLSEALGYSILNDKATPGGVRLIEWLRGYAALQVLAEERYRAEGMKGLYFALPRSDLLAVLTRVGLDEGSAKRFVDLTSLRMSSRDLFDQPLIRMQNDHIMVFGPGVLTSALERVTLSAIGNLGEQLSRKGKAFETEMLKFFRQEGFDAKSLKFKNGPNEYEYDVLIEWDNHIFVFECKNRTLSGNNPVAAYYFASEMDSARKQVLRLVRGLTDNPNIVFERTGIDIADKTIVPCVLNSLTYANKLGEDGIYISDASSLKRFFEDRYFHLIRPHSVGGTTPTVLHRMAVTSLWSGDKPTVSDFLAYLADPLPLKIAKAHTDFSCHGFGLGKHTIATIRQCEYRRMTNESISELFGLEPNAMREDAKKFKRALRRTVRVYKQRSVVKAERAWRKRR